ncbi:MAG TPA: hypothetical protein VFK74_07470 [Azospira sp.]|nr:hypothetical protein [Azospira sp.]
MSPRKRPAVLALAPLALAVCWSTAAGAAPLKVLGFDDMSCQAWIQSRDDGEQRALYIAWMRGVLSGHNYARPAQQVSAISSGTIDNFVNRYCSEKPKGDFGEAILRLSDQFSGRNSPITK